MTKTLKLSLAAGFVAVALAAGSGLVLAQDGPGPRRGPGGPPPAGMRGPGGPMGMGIGAGFRELDLTDDQKTQIKSIAESHQAEFKAVGDKMRAAREGMRALIEADTLDESADAGEERRSGRRRGRCGDSERQGPRANAAGADVGAAGEAQGTAGVAPGWTAQAAPAGPALSQSGSDPAGANWVSLTGWRQPLLWGCLAYFAGLHRHSWLPSLPLLVPSIRAHRSAPSFQ